MNIFTWCWLEKKREGRWPNDLTDCALVQKKQFESVLCWQFLQSSLRLSFLADHRVIHVRALVFTSVHKCARILVSCSHPCVTARHVLKDGIDGGRWLNHRSSFDTLFHSLVIYHLNLMKLLAISGNCEAHACPTAILSTCVSSHNSRWTGTWSLTWLGKEM